MLNINLDNEMEKLIQLCETPIEEELFSKIIKFVIKSSFGGGWKRILFRNSGIGGI